MKNSESVVKNLDVSKKQPTQNYKNKKFSVYFSVLRMGGDMVDKLNAKKASDYFINYRFFDSFSFQYLFVMKY